MAFYHYICENCKLQDVPEDKAEDLILIENNEGVLIWEEKHGMLEEPEIRCPSCDNISSKTLLGIEAPISWTKGNCYLNRADCQKQMDLHKLETGRDPYGYLRQPGEKDHLIDKLKGKVKEKKYYITGSKNEKSKSE